VISRTLQELRLSFSARPDGNWKVAGQKGYLSDRIPADALFARVWRSPIPHGRILSIDTSKAASMPGVVHVVTAADVPGVNGYGVKVRDQPVLCGERVRMVGDPVVAVAATKPEVAALALAAIHVQLEPLPVIVDPEYALTSAATAIHPQGNLCYERHYSRGDIEAALRRGAVRIVDTYQTGRQFHIAMETEGGFVAVKPDGSYAVHVGSHFPHGDQHELAAIIGVNPERIQVTASPMGGSFGGKDTLSIQPVLILLAHLTGRTVSMHRSRTESLMCGETRHPFRIRLETSCGLDGKLLGHRAQLLADTGAYTTKGLDVLDTAFENVMGPYAFEAVDVVGRVAFTNNGNAGAFRGFGAVQAQFAVEQQIDRLAASIGMDPAAFRALNLRALDEGPLGQVATGALHPSHVLAVIAKHPLRRRSARTERHMHGVGISLITKGEGFSKGGPNGGSLSLSLAANGRITFSSGAVEMGQGAVVVGVEATAALLGVATADVDARLGHSDDPNSGPSAASRVTGQFHRGLNLAVPRFRERLLVAAASRLSMPIQRLRLGAQGVWDARPGHNRPLLTFVELAAYIGETLVENVNVRAEETPTAVKAHGDFNAAAARATVIVDRWSGAVRVEHMVVATACGPIVSPLGFAGQVEGGAVMGLGMALLEAVPELNGHYLYRNLDGYMVPTIADAPVIDIIAIEDVCAGDELGPRGIGEISINVAVPAIANAVANAIGAPIRRLPVRPVDVFEALHRREMQ
jgi:nicotinate dehydrogenase large molybdopterin subunit